MAISVSVNLVLPWQVHALYECVYSAVQLDLCQSNLRGHESGKVQYKCCQFTIYTISISFPPSFPWPLNWSWYSSFGLFREFKLVILLSRVWSVCLSQQCTEGLWALLFHSVIFQYLFNQITHKGKTQEVWLFFENDDQFEYFRLFLLPNKNQ